MVESADMIEAFLVAALVPRETSHAAGTLDRAESIRAAHPEVETASIHTAAVLGDDRALQRFLDQDRSLAIAPGGPYGWDPLTHLCFSNYLKLDRTRSAGFVRAATALLDAGASPDTGWWESGHLPEPEWESVLYGAAGVARHADLTRLLLERGGDPNDGETPYHAPEGWDNDALKVLVSSGRLTAESLGVMLLRKTDWHDADGIAWLLAQGVDPNYLTRFGKTALHNAILRDNHLDIIAMLLRHGADPAMPLQGRSAAAMAAFRGRGDILALLDQRKAAVEYRGIEQLVAACARNNGHVVAALLAEQPAWRRELAELGEMLLSGFAGVGNAAGLEHLLDLGLPVDLPIPVGDGYWGYADRATALHIAAWRARHDTVRLLINRGADVNAHDGRGRSPLMLAVLACVDSHWTEWRAPDSVAALLAAGASTAGVRYPCGYDDVDRLLGG